MFGIMMTYHIIRETMSPIELLERDDYLLVSNIELLFKEISRKKNFFKKRICCNFNSAIHGGGRSNLLKDNIRNS